MMAFKSLAKELRLILKARKVTYRMLAAKIGLSESAIKKMLTGNDCSFARVNQICEALGLTLNDLLASFNERRPLVFSLNEKQETYFLASPKGFYFYWRLTHERIPLEEVSARLNLTAAEASHFLYDLDRLNLIELGKGDRVRIPSIKFVDWQITPGFIAKIADHWSRQLIEESVAGKPGSQFIIKYYQLTPESYRELQTKLQSIAEQFARRTVREMIATERKNLREVRLVSAVGLGSFCENRPALKLA